MPIILDGTDSVGDLGDALAAKAPSASPTFTGTVALPSTTTLDGVTLANSGLTLISAQTFTSANAVNVNSVFTSTYTNYRILWRLTAASAVAQLQFRFRASGSDNTTNNYSFATFGYDTGGTLRTNTASGTNTIVLLWNDPGGSSVAIDVVGPQVAASTTLSGTGLGVNSAGTLWGAFSTSAVFNTTTAFDGFSFASTFGSPTTMTGDVRVYGYRNS